MAQNYEVVIACWGRYSHGKVIPEAAIRARGGDPDELVARGVLKPTTKPRNCDIVGAAADTKKPAPGALSAEVIRESNELRRANVALEAEAKILREQVEGKERARAALEKELAAQVAEIDHLSEACERHQAAEAEALAKAAELDIRVKELELDKARLVADNERLTDDLDAATAPTA